MSTVSPADPTPPYRLAAADRGEGVRALMQALLERVVADLSGTAPAPERAHEARKRLKRARGLLRAVRQIDPAYYQRENARLRDIARLLAPIRETGAGAEAIDAVEADYTELLARDPFATVRQGLADGAPAAAAPDHLQATIDSAVANAHLGMAALFHLDWPGDRAIEARALARSVGQLVKKARSTQDASDDGNDTEALHEWRKALKNLWLAERLYRDRAPEGLFPPKKRLRETIDTLGAVHDIDMLLARLANATPGTPPARDALIALLAARRTRLVSMLADQRKALALGKPGRIRKALRLALETERPAPASAAE